MNYKEPLKSKVILKTRETRRKQKNFHKKLGKAWHNKKEYATHFISKKFGKENKTTITTAVSEGKKTGQPIKHFSQKSGIGKLAVYTCIFGGYDNLREPMVKSEFCDYYIVTDQDVSEKSAWKKLTPKQYPEGFDSWHSAIKNRYYKMHPDELFSNYKYSLYIDGNIRPAADLYPMLLEMAKKNKNIGLFAHPIFDCLFDMTVHLKKINLVDSEKADVQMERYHKDGFPKKFGMFECGFILRNHHMQKCKEAMQTWWEEYLNGEKRDQMCFTYALWENGLDYDDVYCFGKNVRENSRLKLREHNREHSKVD